MQALSAAQDVDSTASQPSGADLAQLRSRRLVVIGTGALGSALLERLMQWQIPSVTLIDPDDVEPRNLPLSPLLSRAAANGDGDESKAVLLAREANRTGLLWQPIVAEVADVGWQEFTAADLLICCTDSAISRAETAFLACKTRAFVLDGAVFGDAIPACRVTWFAPEPEAACYLCGMTEDSRAAVLGYAASASLGCRPPREEAAMTGTLATLDRVTDIMADALLHFSPESCSKLSGAMKTEWAQGVWRNEAVMLQRSATCPWHDSAQIPLVPLPWELPLRDALLPGGEELQLAWPICLEAACGHCGARCRPMQRIAAVRRRLRCACCGKTAMQPLRTVHRIGSGDPLASLSPRQLGQPDKHLYWLRGAPDIDESEGEYPA